jgi:hypothetical protein
VQSAASDSNMATTSGFQVSNMPRIDFADPRLLAPNYGAILPAVGQGFQLAEQVQMSPLRRQLAQIQVENAQAQAGLAPLERQRLMAQIAEAEQNAAIPRILPGDVMIEDTTQIYPTAIDETGARTGPDERVLGDLVQVQQEQLVGPGGVITPRTVRKTIKTADQRAAEEAYAAARVEATRALATDRARGKEFETQQLVEQYNTALDEGDTDTAKIYKALIDRKAAMPGLLAPGTTYQRTVEQQAARAGITLGAAQELVRTPEGAAALAQLAVANQAAAKSPFGAPAISADQRALIQSAGAAPAALPLQQRAEQILAPQTQSAVVVRTKAERDALPAGTAYTRPDVPGQIFYKK